VVAGDQSQPVDCLVLGGGPGGYVAAVRAAQCGRSVTLVEGDRLGGVCLNEGCIPGKALMEVAGLRSRVAGMAAAGLGGAAPPVDLTAFQAWKRSLVARLAGEIEELLHGSGVRVVRGWARFAGRTRVGVRTGEESTQYFDFKDVVIATGSRPAPLPSLPFDGDRVCDPGQALDWTDLPTSMVVFGGDPVGLELASAFTLLGSDVALVDPGDRLIPAMDADLSRAAAEAARQAGVRLLLRSRPRGMDGATVVIDTPDGELRLPAARIVVSAGRLPRLDDLDLAAARIRPPVDRFEVDDRLRVERHVFAVGDVTAGPQLAHRASAQGRVAGEVLGGRASAMDAVVVPEVVFAQPPLASAGLTAEGARAGGLEVAVAHVPFGVLGRGLISGAERGWARVVYELDTGRLLGAHVAGGAAGELIAAAVVAIEMGATLEDLALIVQAHPTFAEAISGAAEAGLGRPLHTVSGGSRATL